MGNVTLLLRAVDLTWIQCYERYVREEMFFGLRALYFESANQAHAVTH